LVVQVFQAKLQALLKDITRGVLGEVAAYLYTIEFQKCGLPHISKNQHFLFHLIQSYYTLFLLFWG